GLAVQASILEGQRHVAGELGEELLVVRVECRSCHLVQQLNHANDLSVCMPDGQAQQRLGAVVELLVKGALEEVERVGIIHVDSFGGLRNPCGDPFATGNAYLFGIEPLRHDRPQLMSLAVYQEHATAVGLYLLPRDLENQLQQFRQVECRIEQARSFKEQGK